MYLPELVSFLSLGAGANVLINVILSLLNLIYTFCHDNHQDQGIYIKGPDMQAYYSDITDYCNSTPTGTRL